MLEEKKQGKLFPKPVGPAEHRWCNTLAATKGPQCCEACGTLHPEQKNDEDWYVWDRFLGLELVEDCCGHAIDILYGEFGEVFATAFLEEFAKDPTSPKFGVLRRVLADCLKAAHDRSAELVQETAILGKELADLKR